MSKELKSACDNAWTSTAEGSLNSCSGCGGGCNCGKHKKTATDNQWTSTIKNGDSGCNCK